MELKPEHRDLAIENVEKLNTNPEDVFSDNYESLHTAIMCSFLFSETKEGFDFWRKISNDLLSNTYYDEEAKS